MIDIGQRIRQLRKQKNLTQQQLANRLWLTKAMISAYETGLKFPSLEVLKQLAFTLNTSTDYLLGVNKKHILDVSNLKPSQIELISKIIEEFNILK